MLMGCRGYLLSTTPAGPAFDPPEVTNPGTISGTLTVGSTLSGTGEAWTTPGGFTVTTSRQWLRDGADIPGATAPTYVIANPDMGKTISRRLTASSVWGTDSDVTAGVLIPVVTSPDFSAADFSAADFSTT